MREMTESVTHASRTVGKNNLTGFIIATIAALFMTITGALGTDEAPFLIRLLFWLICMESGAMIGLGATAGIHNWDKLRNRPFAEGALVATFIAAPLTLVVTAARSIIFDLRVPSPAGLLIMFGYVLVVSTVIVAIDYAVMARTRSGDAPIPGLDLLSPAAPVVPDDTRFRDRLPLPLREAVILALQSEDHYLRVHTDNGDALILMRLSDAIAEQPANAGKQTHRSWWVAKTAIADLSLHDGRAMLELNNGVQAPISRSHYSSLKKSGWLR